jgi:hypothetical protein
MLGTTQKWPIDRTWPIEEIVLHVGFTVTTALVPQASPASPDQFDSVLQLLQKINLSVNDGKQPRSVVDSTGIGLLEYCQKVGLNLDEPTQRVSAMVSPQVGSEGTNAAALGLQVGCYEMTYRIPMVHPWIGEPLRTRMYLPAHIYPQDPVLSLTFQSAANMYSSGVIGAIYVDVELIRRVPTAASESVLQKSAGSNPNGYIDWDLIETPFGIAPGLSGEQRFPLPIPGAYTDLVFRQYLGGSPVTRSPIDASGIGNTVALGFGAETRWRLESGLVVIREWRWKHLRALNDFSSPFMPVEFAETLSSGTLTRYSLQTGNIGAGAQMAMSGGVVTNFRSAVSSCFNFLSDGLSGDNCIELGSVLDCNTPANNGLKMELIGSVASVATNGSQLSVIGRRLFGNLSRWQKFA